MANDFVLPIHDVNVLQVLIRPHSLWVHQERRIRGARWHADAYEQVRGEEPWALGRLGVREDAPDQDGRGSLVELVIHEVKDGFVREVLLVGQLEVERDLRDWHP